MYLKIRAGLLDPKHVATMGNAVWLYLWLQTKVHFTGEHAGAWRDKAPYTHQRAADELGVKRARVRDWFDVLRRGRYITAEWRHDGLLVGITRYVCPAENPAPSVAERAENPAPRVRKIPQPAVEKTAPSPAPTRSVRVKLDTEESHKNYIPPLQAEPRPITAVPKPNRYAEVIDAIRARGLEYEPTPRDAKAVKDSTLAPALIAECYEAIARGAWGREFDRDNLSVQYAISRWNAYRSSKTLPPGPGRRGEPRSAVGRELAAARQRGLIDDHGRFTEDAGAPGAEAGADLRALLDAGVRQVRDGVPLKLLG